MANSLKPQSNVPQAPIGPGTPSTSPTEGPPSHGLQGTGLPRPEEPRYTSVTGENPDSPGYIPPGDPDFDIKASLEYVETPNGPVCGTCRFARGNICVKIPQRPFVVDLVNGCCKAWRAADMVVDQTKDYLEAVEEMSVDEYLPDDMGDGPQKDPRE